MATLFPFEYLLTRAQVLTEIRAGPRGDERQTFRRAVLSSVMISCFLYVMVNVAFVSNQSSLPERSSSEDSAKVL
jgi:hypothetical protein